MSRRALHVGVDVGPAVRPYTGAMANDARALRAIFSSRCGFVSDPPLLGSAATYEAVTTALAAVIAECTDGDSLLLTFAAHGRSQPNVGESIQLADRFFGDADMQALLEPLRLRDVDVTILVDACQSDGFGTIERCLPLGLALVVRRVVDKVKPSRRGAGLVRPVASAQVEVADRWRLYLLAACRKDESAYADCGTVRAPRGCFSAAIEALMKPGTESVAELMNAVTCWIGARHTKQHPCAEAFGRAQLTDVFLQQAKPGVDNEQQPD